MACSVHLIIVILIGFGIFTNSKAQLLSDRYAPERYDPERYAPERFGPQRQRPRRPQPNRPEVMSDG